MLTALGWFLIAVGIASTAFGVTGHLLAYSKAKNRAITWWDFVRLPIIFLLPMLTGLILLEVAS